MLEYTNARCIVGCCTVITFATQTNSDWVSTVSGGLLVRLQLVVFVTNVHPFVFHYNLPAAAEQTWGHAITPHRHSAFIRLQLNYQSFSLLYLDINNNDNNNSNSGTLRKVQCNQILNCSFLQTLVNKYWQYFISYSLTNTHLTALHIQPCTTLAINGWNVTYKTARRNCVAAHTSSFTLAVTDLMAHLSRSE